LGYFDPKGAHAANATRRRNLQLRQVVRRTVQAIEACSSLTEVWNALRRIAADLHVARLEFWFHVPTSTSGEREGLHYELERIEGSAPAVELLVELGPHDSKSLGNIHATWHDGRLEVDRD